jgi:hypothetical protein
MAKIAENCDHNIDPWPQKFAAHFRVRGRIDIYGSQCCGQQVEEGQVGGHRDEAEQHRDPVHGAEPPGGGLQPADSKKNANIFAKFFCENILKNPKFGPFVSSQIFLLKKRNTFE